MYESRKSSFQTQPFEYVTTKLDQQSTDLHRIYIWIPRLGTLGPRPPLPSNLNYYNIDHPATCIVLLPCSLGELGSPLFTGVIELPATILLVMFVHIILQ